MFVDIDQCGGAQSLDKQLIPHVNTKVSSDQFTLKLIDFAE